MLRLSALACPGGKPWRVSALTRSAIVAEDGVLQLDDTSRHLDMPCFLRALPAEDTSGHSERTHHEQQRTLSAAHGQNEPLISILQDVRPNWRVYRALTQILRSVDFKNRRKSRSEISGIAGTCYTGEKSVPTAKCTVKVEPLHLPPLKRCR